MNNLNVNTLPKIELRETATKKGFIYEAVENGVVVATRNSVRPYVAALIDDSRTIRNGVGRMDLLPNALKNTSYRIRAVALKQ